VRFRRSHAANECALFDLITGDRIHVSNKEQDLSADGSSGWIVEKVDLFSTTICYGNTNERATVSNGTLARSRIVNAARSPNAICYVNLKVRTIFAFTPFLEDRRFLTPALFPF